MSTRPPDGTVPIQLKALRTKAGLSVREVAAFLEMPASTYAHYETPRYKKPYIPLDLAEKLAVLFAPKGVEPADVFALAGVEEANQLLLQRAPGAGETEISEFLFSDEEGGFENRLVQALYGRKDASLWQVRSRSLDLAGLLPGDVVIIAPDRTDARPGEIVCATIYNWQDSAPISVLRLYEPPYLLAASTDPQFRKPELVDHDRVIIKGLVVASFRKTRRWQGEW